MSRPRTPKVNREALTGRDPMEQFRSRFKQYEALRTSGDIPTTYIGFEALGAILSARQAGFSEGEILAACPSEWGHETLTVPVALIAAIAGAWMLYKNAEKGTPLGQVFGLEGDKQGKHRIKDKLATVDQQRELASRVEKEYLAAGMEGKAISEDQACELVAEETDKAFSSVRAAHKAFKAEIRKGLQAKGVIPSKG